MIGSDHCESIALVEADPSRLAVARDLAGMGDAACFEDVGEAIAACDADAVIVAAPLDLRADLVIQALAADLHVLVEAPLAPSVEEAGRCVTIAANRGVRLMLLPDSEPVDRLLEEFYRYVTEGVEPPSSGRRMLLSPP